jgi:hypothetical protein
MLAYLTAEAQITQRFFSCSDFFRGEIRINNLPAAENKTMLRAL